MNDSGHHSIGEVLSLLKDEYPDVTISKIRFLESQGLIAPERTPSGYRKFYDDDIERLRWILTQQRDNFLPLKVMKQRIVEAGFDPIAERTDAAAGETAAPEPALFRDRREAAGTEPAGADTDPPDEAESEPEGVEAAAPDPKREKTDEKGSGDAPSARARGRADAGSVCLSAAELAAASDIDAQLLTDLIKLGLIVGTDIDSDTVYDHEALVVAKAAAAYSRRGFEARHLRMFKISAEREAGVLAQVLAPLARKADGSAQAEMNELVELGETIHRSILRRLLGPQVD